MGLGQIPHSMRRHLLNGLMQGERETRLPLIKLLSGCPVPGRSAPRPRHFLGRQGGIAILVLKVLAVDSNFLPSGSDTLESEPRFQRYRFPETGRPQESTVPQLSGAVAGGTLKEDRSVLSKNLDGVAEFPEQPFSQRAEIVHAFVSPASLIAGASV